MNEKPDHEAVPSMYVAHGRCEYCERGVECMDWNPCTPQKLKRERDEALASVERLKAALETTKEAGLEMGKSSDEWCQEACRMERERNEAQASRDASMRQVESLEMAAARKRESDRVLQEQLAMMRGNLTEAREILVWVSRRYGIDSRVVREFLTATVLEANDE